MSKLLFLHDNDELKVDGILGSILDFGDAWLAKTPADIFNTYDVFVLDISKYKNWYAQYRIIISANPAWKTIFVHPSGVSIEKDLQEVLMNLYKVDSIIKEFPTQYQNKADLVQKILSGHLPSIEVAGASCFAILYSYLKKKFN